MSVQGNISLLGIVFFFTIGVTKSHTPSHESLFQCLQCDGQHTDLLAWNSLRREPVKSKTSRTRAARAALKMAIFRQLFSTLRLRCKGSGLTCLPFVLKLVSMQIVIWGWSSTLTCHKDDSELRVLTKTRDAPGHDHDRRRLGSTSSSPCWRKMLAWPGLR